ncbi:MAG: hypothetical protein E4H32_06845 [Nitrospirales bacterium]|nr:MAG: hypothetical protein E4H32_06845 [Nitrospirales bacterium]
MKAWYEHWQDLKKQKAQKPNEQPYISKNFQANLNRLGEREKALMKVAELIQSTNLINSKPQLLETMKLLGVLVLTAENETTDNLANGILAAIKKAGSQIKIEAGKDIIVEQNYKIELVSQNSPPPNDTRWLNGDLWGLEKIEMPKAWKEAGIDWTQVNGDIILAVIDSGIQAKHPDLERNMWKNPHEIEGNNIDDLPENGYKDDIHGANIRAKFSKSNCMKKDDQVEGNPFDQTGHGTHVAGVAAAVGNNDDSSTTKGTVGVIGNGLVKIMAVKITCKDQNRDDDGSYAHAIQAIEYAANMGAHVVNMSWVLPPHMTKTEILKETIARFDGEGKILFVAAAGNDKNSIDGAFKRYPASFGAELKNVITVAASDESDHFWVDSNKGPKSVHLAAPGTSIYSTKLNTTTNTSTIDQLPGTSVAAPFVAGCAAFIQAVRQSLNPPKRLLNPLELRNILIRSGDFSDALALDVGEGELRGKRLNCNTALVDATQNH